MPKDYAEKNTILRGVVGGQAHGIRNDPNSDRDEMGVFIEAPEHVMGLSPYDHYIFRTQPEGVRSGPGDLDLTIYSLRKFVRLAAQGNPTVLSLLWLPEYITADVFGKFLLEIREKLVSKEAGKRFLGYLVSQKKKMKGEKAHTVNRPDLVEKYGYDTKFAMHAARLGLEGIEYLEYGTMTFPKVGDVLETLRDIRYGKYSEMEAIEYIEFVEHLLSRQIDKCDKKVDYEFINDFLVEMHTDYWGYYPQR